MLLKNCTCELNLRCLFIEKVFLTPQKKYIYLRRFGINIFKTIDSNAMRI